MGWAFFFLFGVAAMGALVLLGLGRALWPFAGAALMLGGVGYALQGRQWLTASPAKPNAETTADTPDLIDLRDRMLGRFSGDGAYVTAADAMLRIGDRRAAVQVLLGGLQKIPESVFLWTMLGSVLAIHDGNQVSPPALFAFQQAARLSPAHPAPPFFLGQAYVRAGDLARARPYWFRAVQLTPVQASYRNDIALRLAILDRFLELQRQAPAR